MKFDIKTLLTTSMLNVVIILIIALGLLVRFYIVKAGFGYQDDDYALLSSAINFSYFDILTKPLEYDQCCPPLFVVILKILYSHFGLNHQIFTLGGGISSGLALIILPVLTYKIYKNKIPIIIAVLIFAFNIIILYYTQRIKQYSTDVFFTIFLIYAGYIIFSKSITKRKTVLYSIFSIFCVFISYTSSVMIACLCFYYLFFGIKDNIKIRIINLLIFIIPYFLTFFPYMIFSVGSKNINNNGLIDFWSMMKFYIENFEHLKKFICYLFGKGLSFNYFHGSPTVTSYEHFEYLLIPIIIGIIIILIQKNKYLFSVLILPIIIAQLLGVLNIYPTTADRTSLWLCPIFIILFTYPAIYVKFNKKIFSSIISLIIITFYFYYFVYDKTIDTINKYYNGNNFRQWTFNFYFDELRKSDITEKDIIIFNWEPWRGPLLSVFDSNGDFSENQKIALMAFGESDEGIKEINLLSPQLSSIKQNMYIYLLKCSIFQDDDYQWIKDNLNIIYEYETWNGDKFIKAKIKSY